MVLAPIGNYRRIRRLNYDDLNTLVCWDNDPEINRLTGRKFHENVHVDGWWEAILRDRSRIGFAIAADDGSLIGDVELEQISWRTKEAELRIAIGDKQFWGRGFGTEAVREVLHIAFDGMNLERIYLRVQEDNLRAIRSYGKAGFRKVARLIANGRLTGAVDLVLMEVVRDSH
ncbi:MAG: GNAT family N-acetyltransferase [Sulfobacillus sp.]